MFGSQMLKRKDRLCELFFHLNICKLKSRARPFGFKGEKQQQMFTCLLFPGSLNLDMNPGAAFSIVTVTLLVVGKTPATANPLQRKCLSFRGGQRREALLMQHMWVIIGTRSLSVSP